jgi:plasmid stabilization system protein ParE
VKVEWTECATQRLGEIHDFIATESLETARAVSEKLIDRTEQLGRFPLSGPILPEDGAYRQLAIDGYRIVYQVKDGIVYVMTIVSPGMLAEHAL